MLLASGRSPEEIANRYAGRYFPVFRPSARPSVVLRGRPAGVQICIAHGCAGAAERMDAPVRRTGERPPGKFVELPTAWFVARYSIQLTPGA